MDNVETTQEGVLGASLPELLGYFPLNSFVALNFFCLASSVRMLFVTRVAAFKLLQVMITFPV